MTAIELVDSIEQSVHIRRGTLTGLNTRRGTFEIVDNASGERYSGSVAAEAREQIDGLPVGHASFVTADVVVEVDFAADEQVTGRKHTLIAIRPFDPDER